jgi:hypothetical protein
MSCAIDYIDECARHIGRGLILDLENGRLYKRGLTLLNGEHHSEVQQTWAAALQPHKLHGRVIHPH